MALIRWAIEARSTGLGDKMDLDIQANFGLFWSGATLVHERGHGGRRLQVHRSVPVENRAASYIVVIYSGNRFEGWITLSPEGEGPRIHGNLVTKEFESYSVSIDSFAGGPFELADLAGRLLDYGYKFPPDSGVTADHFVWTKKPKVPNR
jgi:hypothetical protein